ncbi:MAG: polyprenyl synthetase family protein [Candidatus Omnitrophota bacterium]|jgi:geranylgeranyl diphosphate synthase type I
MISRIKNRIEQELVHYIRSLNQAHSLSRISPVLYANIKNFLCRKGKRIRPTLFVIGYLGFAGKPVPGLYRSAVSLELLHDFMLVHDDIIDKSATRRGQPSMHEMLNQYLARYKNIKFTGEDLTIVIGDVMYAMALEAFLSVKENPQRKEAALKKLIQAALYTGSGEFIELLYGAKGIDKITRKDIYKIYDLKTANYTFAAPLSMGAALAGAKKSASKILYNLGIYLGRAFQIQDDCLGLFGKERKTGKSGLSDLQEAKKTILVWYAYRKSSPRDKSAVRRIFAKKKVDKKDLLAMQKIVLASGALQYARKEINRLTAQAKSLSARVQMRQPYQNLLLNYSKEILKLI